MSHGVLPPYGWDGRADEVPHLKNITTTTTAPFGAPVQLNILLSSGPTENALGEPDTGLDTFILTQSGPRDRIPTGIVQTANRQGIPDDGRGRVVFRGIVTALVGRAALTTAIPEGTKLCAAGSGANYLEGGTVPAGVKCCAILLTDTGTLVAGTPIFRDVWFNGVEGVAEN